MRRLREVVESQSQGRLDAFICGTLISERKDAVAVLGGKARYDRRLADPEQMRLLNP